MLLSIGMMVKNEEKHLDDCLKSLQPILDSLESELVIVDTGSTDSTVDIAKRYTKNIYYKKWENDFSGMRNYSISLCKGKWFFCIDGDEVLEDASGIIEFFNSGDYKEYFSASMKVKNYIISNSKEKYGFSDTIRLFKKEDDFRYEGSVHNQPIFKQPIKRIKCTIEHYGYISDDKELMEKKFVRTSSLLKKELKKNPESIYYRYQLAVTYSMHSDYEDALKQISIVYNKLDINEKKRYVYIFDEYANILRLNGKVRECEEICKKELNLFNVDMTYKIDLFFFFAKSQFDQRNYREAIKNYNKYIELLDKWEYGNLPVDLTTKVLTSSNREIAYADIALIHYYNKRYDKAIDMVNKIKEEKRFESLLSVLINSMIKLEDYELIEKEYKEKILNMSQKTIRMFETTLENVILDSKNKKDIMNVTASIFSEKENYSYYILLNKLRILKESREKYDLYQYIVENVDLNEESNCFGDILYIGLINDYDITSIIKKLRQDKCIEFLDYCDKKYKNISEVILDFINKKQEYDDKITENKTNIILCNALLILDNIDDASYKSIFKRYINHGISLIKQVYTPYVLDNARVLEVKNSEHEFFVYMMKAEENKKDNKKEYIKDLRYSLKSYPKMKKGIEMLLDEFNVKDSELSKLGEECKKNIKILLDDGKIKEAEMLINECEKYLKYDAEFYSIKAVIQLLKNEFEDAEKTLLKGLEIDRDNFDLIYNLAYVYFNENNIKMAYEYYKKAQTLCRDEKILLDINQSLEEIENNYSKSIEDINKPKIAFLVKQGMDSFIDDVIKGIDQKYEKRKIIVTNYNQIDEAMEWADICWFEWCDELVAYGSKSKLAKKKKIICRIHGYEVYTNYIKEVEWRNIEDLIIVAPHIRGLFEKRMLETSIEKVNIHTIFCGVDDKKYPIMMRKKGFDIGYLGYINFKKNIPLTLEIFKKVYDIDDRYRLHIAGKFQDERTLEYYKYFIKENKLEGAVNFYGWQNYEGKLKFFEKIDYMLISSIDEGLCFAAAEAMCNGIKPILHNCEGIKDHYDKKYIFSSIDEAVEMICENKYDSREYREFIEKNYSLEKQIEEINSVISSL